MAKWIKTERPRNFQSFGYPREIKLEREIRNVVDALGVGSTAVWGNITGSITDQPELQNIFTQSKEICVSKEGNDTTGNGSLASPYLTIKKAVDEANLVASAVNPISVSIATGIYLEDTISVSSHVFIKSTDQDSAIIRPNDNSLPLFQLTEFTGLSFLTIEDVTNSNAVEIDNASEYCVLHKIYIRDCDKGVVVNSTTTDSYAYLEYVAIDNSVSCAIEVVSTTNVTELSCENTYVYNVDSLPSVADIVSDGVNSKVLFHTGSIVNQFLIGSGKGIVSTNDGKLRLRNLQIEGYQYGIYTDTGAADIQITGCTFDSNTYNIYINSVTAVGYFNGYSEYTKIFIHADSAFFVTNDDVKTITVAKKGGNFDSIVDAINAITDNSSTNRYVVLVNPGIYTENPIVLKPYVSLHGVATQSVEVEPLNTNHHIIELDVFSEVRNLTLNNAGSGYAALFMQDKGAATSDAQYAKAAQIDINNCDLGIYINGTDSLIDTHFYGEFITIKDSITNDIKVTNSGGICACANIVHLLSQNTSTDPIVNNYISGHHAEFMAHACMIEGNGFNTAFRIEDEAHADISATVIDNSDTGIELPNVGGGQDLIMSGVNFTDCTTNLSVLNPAATGNYTGYSEYGKTNIAYESPFFISGKDPVIISVSKKGGDFTSVKEAVDSISDASTSKRYIVKVGAGVFIEDTITMKAFVDISGESFTATIIEVDNVNKDVILAVPNSGLFNIQLRGATGANKAAVRYTGGAGVFRCLLVRFGANYSFINQTSTSGTATSAVTNCSAEATSNYTIAFDITDNGVNTSTLAFTNFIYVGNGDTFIKAYGTKTVIAAANLSISKTGVLGYGVHCYNGADLGLNACTFNSHVKAVYNENTGVGVGLYLNALTVRGNTSDIEVLSPTTTGSISTLATKDKVTVADGAEVSMILNDITGKGVINLGGIWIGEGYNSLFDATDLITGNGMGLHSGGELSVDSGLDIIIEEGFGYIEDESFVPEIHNRIEWATQGYTMPDNSDLYIYFNTNGILSTSSSRPDVLANIILGRVFTQGGSIIFIDNYPNRGEHLGDRIAKGLASVFGAIFESGSLTTANASRQLAVTSGSYWLGDSNFTPVGKAAIDNFTPVYKDSTPGQWLFATPTAVVLNDKYDNSTGTLANATASYYVKHNLYVVKDGIERYFLLIGQEEHATLNDATNAANPTKPSFFKDSVVLIASVITQQGNATFTQLADERPRPTYAGSGTLGVTDHGSLTGLSNNDHPQYLLKAGDTMTGNINMGGNQITNVGNVDGVDISAHASRHLPNGSDALTTGAASSISRLTNNEEGIANAFARQDHSHEVIEEVATIIITSNSTTTLNTDSSNRIIFTGSTFGQVLNLGDATTYTLGKINNLYNNSTQTISIVNNSSTEIFRLEPYCKVEVILQDNTITDGGWLFSVTYPDYDKFVLVLDDFISGTTAGQSDWLVTANGGGAGATQTTNLFSRPGVNQISTGTNASGRTTLHKGGNAILFDNGVVVTEMSVRFEDLSTVTERYTFYAGFGDNTGAGDQVDGVYFEYAEGTSGNFWRIKTSNNSTRTTTVTSSPIVADTWYKLKIEVAPGGTRADFFVNGANIGNITTNIPSGPSRNTGHLVKLEKSAGTTARLAYVDYINSKTFLTR